MEDLILDFILQLRWCCLSSVQIFCSPMECSLPGSSVPRISQARILKWVAIFFLQGIFLTQLQNPLLLHWQANCLPLSYQGSPYTTAYPGSNSEYSLLNKTGILFPKIYINRECHFKHWEHQNFTINSNLKKNIQAIYTDNILEKN